MLSFESYEDLNKHTNLTIKINTNPRIIKDDMKKDLYSEDKIT